MLCSPGANPDMTTTPKASPAPTEMVAATIPPPERTLDLVGTSAIGIGAIVGGGILVLAGAALRSAGPSAILAFGLNGLIALMTALSFAELAATFPENGGAYMYARKVLGVRPAFAVGWILCLAYIVAGVLYALGFAEYGLACVAELWPGPSPAFVHARWLTLTVAVSAVLAYTISLIRKTDGKGDLATWGKVVVFVVLIAVGLATLPTRADPAVRNGLSPFFAGGGIGVIMTMGFTFIALQGFEIIGAVGGEVKEPAKTIPRAMLISLGASLLIYLPLLFVVTTAGVPPGDSIVAMSDREPATVMATAVGNYLGKVGSWLVLIAGVLATLSALRANILAASRVAVTMARDRTLPTLLGQEHQTARTPVVALYATALAVVSILFVVPDLAAAGSAASLIFLVCFAIGHAMAWLSRRRLSTSDTHETAFRAPFFPVLPIAGTIACVALAIFQAVVVPSAGGIAIVWLGLGVLLYFGVFSTRARVVDASALAYQPELLKLRGHSPAVLVPIANPDNANELIRIASILAPPRVGRVLLLNVVDPSASAHGDPIQNAQDAVGQALRASLREGHSVQALLSVSSTPWHEIRRVAHEYRCYSILLGAPHLTEERIGQLEGLINSVDSSVSFLFAPEDWTLAEVGRAVVPVGGRGSHHALRAKVLGGLLRTLPDGEVHWLRALPEDATEGQLRSAERQLRDLAADVTPERSRFRADRAADASRYLLDELQPSDLLVLGLAAKGGRHVFGSLLPELIRRSPCACLVIARGDEGEHLGSLVRQATNRMGSPFGLGG
jgi:APA family basic amino acid/polyamine antiporter